MKIRPLDLPDAALLTPTWSADARGSFAEIWNDLTFRKNVADIGFVQDNFSISKRAGTIRGVHCQRPPAAQGKLVSVLRGPYST